MGTFWTHLVISASVPELLCSVLEDQFRFWNNWSVLIWSPAYDTSHYTAPTRLDSWKLNESILNTCGHFRIGSGAAWFGSGGPFLIMRQIKSHCLGELKISKTAEKKNWLDAIRLVDVQWGQSWTHVTISASVPELRCLVIKDQFRFSNNLIMWHLKLHLSSKINLT